MTMSEATKAIDRFQDLIDETLEYYSELLIAVTEKKRQGALETMLAEQCAMSLAVSWEAFINDLLIAYVSMSPDVFKKDLESRVSDSLKSRYGDAAARWVKFRPPRSPNKLQLMRVIDPKGWNVTANSAEELSKRANQLLPAADAKKFSLDVADSTFVDYAISLRNYLSHRSRASRAEVKARIAQMQGSPQNAPLAGALTTVGAYLKTRAVGERTRSHFVGARLREVSEKLR
jgi:hypothetical protein